MQLREAHLGAFEIPRVVGDDGPRIPGDRQLDKMIVGFIGQVRSPQVVHAHPRAATDERGQQGIAFPVGDRRAEERLRPRQHRLVLREQGLTYQRLVSTRQGATQNLSVESTTGAVVVGAGGSCYRRLSPVPVPHSSP